MELEDVFQTHQRAVFSYIRVLNAGFLILCVVIAVVVAQRVAKGHPGI